jgi:hypothetical protein
VLCTLRYHQSLRHILLTRRDLNFDFNERQLPTFLHLFVSGSISRSGTDFKQ